MDFFNKQIPFKIVFILLALLVALTVIVAGRQRGEQFGELQEEKRRLEQRQLELNQTKQRLTARKEQLQGDPYLIKQIARNRLGLIPPGEKQIWLKNPGLETTGETATARFPPQNQPPPLTSRNFLPFKD